MYSGFRAISRVSSIMTSYMSSAPYVRLANFIGGNYSATTDYIENINPANNSVINLVPRSTKDDVQLAVDASKSALALWMNTPLEQRALVLNRAADIIERRLDEFARAESLDTGKPLRLSTRLDIDRVVHNFRFFSRLAVSSSEDLFQQDSPQNAFHMTVRRPVGIVGLITPWNLPLYLLSWKVAPALIMGNAIIAKPSELTPTTAFMLTSVLTEAGVPPGIFNLIHGLGPEAGQAIIEHPEIRAISFTGGTKTGQLVAATAISTFKKLSLEMGGKNPTIVMNDCDYNETLNGVIRSSFLNSGQICLCGSRILVQAEIYDRFVSDFVNKVQLLIVGDPMGSTPVDLGPVISSSHLEKINGFVSRTTGRVLCGGRLAVPNSNYYLPTVIETDCESDECVQEEIFGPVVTIQKFHTEQQAIDLANGVRYGLCASIWTSDLNQSSRLALALDAGMVWVNTWLLRDLRTPFGGVKSSGFGREGGKYSLDFYSEIKNICLAFNNKLDSRSINTPPPMPGGGWDRLSLSNVLPPTTNSSSSSSRVVASKAPKAVGAYPHARIEGNLVFLSGIGPRNAETNSVPGGPVLRNADTGQLLPREAQTYDIQAQTRAVIDNCRAVLEASGSSLDKVIDVTCYLVDMDRDFRGFNAVYNETFAGIGATRTTLSVIALPTPIAVEFKIVAKL